MKNIYINKFLLKDQNNSSKAVITSSSQTTYKELLEIVSFVSSSLKEKGISENEHVGIIGKNDFNFVTIVLSLWQISSVPVPLNPRLTEKEINEQLAIAKCKCVLISKDFANGFQNISAIKIEYPVEHSPAKVFQLNTDLNPTQTAAIIFTSGSSGKPKGVELSFNSFYKSALSGNHLLRHSNSDRWLASLPFYHVGGFSIITRSILFGVPVIIPGSLSTKDVSISIEKFNPTFLSLVNPQLKRLIDENVKPGIDLKYCLLGGGFSDNNLAEKAIELGWKICKVYGSTETCSFVTALTYEEFPYKQRSSGRVLPGNEIKIFNDDGEELGPFETGEIVISSEALMKGHINEEKESRDKIKNGYYYSGDTGCIDDEGYLFVEARKNNMISTGGENVNPAEVETLILQYPLIDEAVVFPLRDKEWGEIIAAAIVLKDSPENFSEDNFRKFLKEKTAGYKIPKKIFVEESLPKTEMGKTESRKLIEKYQS